MTDRCRCRDCEETRAIARRWSKPDRVPRVKYPRLRWFLAGLMIGTCVARIASLGPRAGTTIVQRPACTDLHTEPFDEPKSPGIRL